METFVFLPYSKYKALDARAKKEESDEIPASQSKYESEEVQPPPPEPLREEGEEKSENRKLGEDLTKNYRNSQIKLIHHLERKAGSKDIVSLPNLDQLITTALSSSKKKFPMRKPSSLFYLRTVWLTL